MFNEVVEAVARIGPTLRSAPKMLPVALFLKSGYLEHRANVTKSALTEFFSDHPELVLGWSFFSLDSRCELPMVLATTRFPGDPWKVIETKADGSLGEILEFATGAESCAHFVESYVQKLATHAR